MENQIEAYIIFMMKRNYLIFLFSLAFSFAAAGIIPLTAHASVVMETGSYLGSGLPRSITNVGFRPQAVIIKGDAKSFGVWHSSAMPINSTAYLAKDSGNFIHGITSLENDGFSLGTANEVNESGVEYHYIAFGDDGMDGIFTGSYTGNGASNRSITEMPFQPALLFIKQDGPRTGVWKSQAMPSGTSSFFGMEQDVTNGTAIEAFLSDGFRLGASQNVNATGAQYYYVAFPDSALLHIGSYTGNGAALTLSLPFPPGYAWVKSAGANGDLKHRTISQWGDDSASFTPERNQRNTLTAMTPTGFTIGNVESVNAAGQKYWYVAWHDENQNPRIPGPLGPSSKESSTANLSLYFSVTSNAMATFFNDSLRSFVRAQDVFQISSGGTSALNMTNVNNIISSLLSFFPDNQIIGHTSGLTNLTTMAQQISPVVTRINYNYEPSFWTIPEFTFDPLLTLVNMQQAALILHSYGKQASASITGRPLYYETKYGWNYGAITNQLDYAQIQTQTYCHDRITIFREILTTLFTQHQESSENWHPQITVAGTSQANGVFPDRAAECAQEVVAQGLAKLTVWWASTDQEDLREFLIRIGRDSSFINSVSVTEGKILTQSDPLFIFGLFDPNRSDTVAFHIQVDDTRDFSSPVIDYTSALGPQGAQTFTVGQTPNGGLYSAGSINQNLASGTYYWRVQTIDQHGVKSPYQTANKGSLAFLIASSEPVPAPTPPTPSLSPRPSSTPPQPSPPLATPGPTAPPSISPDPTVVPRPAVTPSPSAPPASPIVIIPPSSDTIGGSGPISPDEAVYKGYIPSSSFRVAQAERLYILDDDTRMFSIAGSQFLIGQEYQVELFDQTNTKRFTFNATRINDSNLQVDLSKFQIKSVPKGFYRLVIKRTADSHGSELSTPLLVTKRGDIWSKDAAASAQKRDGLVNIYDISRMLSKWKSADTDDLKEIDIDHGVGNISQGKIDMYDMSKLLTNWTKTNP